MAIYEGNPKKKVYVCFGRFDLEGFTEPLAVFDTEAEAKKWTQTYREKFVDGYHYREIECNLWPGKTQWVDVNLESSEEQEEEPDPDGL